MTMVKGNQETKVKKVQKRNQTSRKKSGNSSKGKSSPNFVEREVCDPKLLSGWKPIDVSVIDMLQCIQESHAVPIFVDGSHVAGEASALIRSHQKSIIAECRSAIGPNTKHNFPSLKKDIRVADQALEFLRSKVEYLDSQILREQRKLEKLEDAVEVVTQ